MAPGRIRFVDFMVHIGPPTDPPPATDDFSLTADLLTRNPPYGTMAQVEVAVVPIGGFSGRVYISLVHEQPGTSYAPSNREATPGSPVVITFPTTGYGDPPQDLLLRVSGLEM